MRQKNILPVLFVTLLLDMIGIGMLIPVIPSLFTDAHSSSFMLAGYSVSAQYVIAGLITALFGFMQFLAAPILGELSDMYGRKKLLTLGVATLAVSQLLFATGITVRSLLLLFVSRAIAGVAGANFSIAQASIADVTAPENRARNFGLIGAAFGLGFILGPLLGGWLTAVSGNPAVPFMVAGLLGIINVTLVTFFLTETHHERKAGGRVTVMKALHNIGAAYNDHDARPLYLAGFFSMLGFGFFTSFISIFLVARFHFTEGVTGTYFAIVGFWIVMAQVFVVRLLTQKYSERTILLRSLPTLAVVILLHPFITEVGYLYAIMPIMASSVALTTTNIPALISKGVSKDKQGAALGINGSLQALSQGIAPLVAGVASGYLGITASFIVGGLFVFAAFYIISTTKKKKEADPIIHHRARAI